MTIAVVTLAERPDLAGAVHDMPTGWPEIMLHDPMGWNEDSARLLFPAYQLVALDGDSVVAKGHSVPFPWSGDADDLPDQGWDDVLGLAVHSHCSGRPLTAVSALEITIHPGRRGEGLSGIMLTAMRDTARRLGHRDLVAPVRPVAKHQHPRMPMSDYVGLRREDGLPVDPWIRVHVRLGGVILKVCPASMSIAGSLRQWRQWTGMALERSGDVEVPGALSPVHVCLEQDHAVYVEPNVWIHHRLGTGPGS